MADSDSISAASSSQSADDDVKRLRISVETSHNKNPTAGKTNKMATTSSNGGPEVGANYPVRRLDNTYRTIFFSKFFRVIANYLIVLQQPTTHCNRVYLLFTDTAEVIETRPSETTAGQLEYYVHYANC